MEHKEMAVSNRILEIKSGSHLYGLETEKSDTDFIGIFLPSKELVYGFDICDEVDLSLISKLKNNKNSKEAIDRKLYNFKKFIKLAQQNNPSIIEYLFVNDKNIEFINEFGKDLLKKAELFPYLGLKDRFVKYAVSQKKKMIIKKENYNELEKGLEILKNFIDNDESRLILPQCENYNEFKKIFKIKNQTDNHYKIGDISLVKNQTVKKAYQKIKKRTGEKSNRKELIKSKGYDYKFGSHLIRLLIEGEELLQTGKIEFPLKRKDEIMDIKQGNWSLNKVLQFADNIELEIEKNIGKSILPEEPRIKEIQNFMIETFDKWFCNE